MLLRGIIPTSDSLLYFRLVYCNSARERERVVISHRPPTLMWVAGCEDWPHWKNPKGVWWSSFLTHPLFGCWDLAGEPTHFWQQRSTLNMIALSCNFHFPTYTHLTCAPCAPRKMTSTVLAIGVSLVTWQKQPLFNGCFNGKINYKWGILYCHEWIPEDILINLKKQRHFSFIRLRLC